MKKLLTYTSTLLRTVMLFGALAFVNVPQIQAQTPEQLAAMPNAFETIDPTKVDWSQKPYFYIQFDEGDVHSFLGEFGLTKVVQGKDYIPFAKNIQWTLESTGTDGQYYLKSKNGNYLRPWPTNATYFGASPTIDDNTSKVTLQELSDGFYAIDTGSNNCLGRENGNEWGRIRKFASNSSRARLRFAKLKSNIAHIIYYRGEHADGKDNTGDNDDGFKPSATETRHYLTYSGADYGTRSLIDNGTLEGNDNSCFYSPNGNTNSEITNVGRENSRGIKVTSSGNEANDYNTQFFIKAKSIIPIGTTVRVDFDYRADVAVNGIPTQAQAQPSQYIHWDAIGSINFTVNWQHFSKEIIVSEQMGGTNDNFQTIAFNLGKKAATSFYFDNIVFTYDDADVSSRQSIIPSDKSLWSLPTVAAYHQDGLWTLEESGNNGEFYIKKYGTEQYLNAVQSGTTYYSDLGTKDAVYGKYKVEDANANRYTAIQNTQYETGQLTAGLFYQWNVDGTKVSDTPTQVAYRVGTNETMGGGVTVAGTDEVDYLKYADLTGYTKMIVNGTSGMLLRVLMNRQWSNNGPLVEKTVTIGNDGKAVVDLTGLELNYSLPTQQATVKATYVNGNDANVNTSYGEIAYGQPVYCGYNIINEGRVELANKDWGVNNIAYLEVDASAINGSIKRVTLTGDFQQISDRGLAYGVGYNNSAWSSTMTWNTADPSIITMGGVQIVDRATTDRELSFDITDAFQTNKKMTILVYNTGAGAGYIKNPRVNVEYSPDITMPYVHLNAIKTGWGGASGTISSIELVNENNISSASRYLHFDKGDGCLVPQWTSKYNDCWYAGFYPVEVPVPNKDDFYQVLVHIPVIYGNPILDYNGSVYGDNNSLWQLEQVGDYRYFRLKRPDTGQYLAGDGLMTDPNDPNGESHEGANKAEINDNKKFLTDFSLTWVFKNPVPKEIVVDHYVTHKESYLRAYADDQVIADQEGLERQGLSTDIDSDWKNFTGDLDGFTQKTNHFEITHYVKKNDSRVIEFPTVLNRNNDHIFFQRFYHYGKIDTEMDLDNLKAHVSLDTPDDGNVQYFLYKNGMVTGQKLDWTGIDDGGFARNEQRRFNFTNSDGKSFTVAVDVSRYSDLAYEKDNHLEGNLKEPSLTMRYLYYMNDAKEMAKKLTAYPETFTEVTSTDGMNPADEHWYVSTSSGFKLTTDATPQANTTYYKGSDKWMEAKEIHFGRTQVSYTPYKKVGYRGEFIGVRHIFSDYWVYDDPDFIKRDASGNVVEDQEGNPVLDLEYISGKGIDIDDEDALNTYLDGHLVSAVNDDRSGKIEVEIDDPYHTGIREGGYNPVLGQAGLNGYGEDGNDADYQGFYFYDLLSPNVKWEYGNSRFVVFRYPKADEKGIVQVANYGPDKPAYLNVYLRYEGKRYQLAQYKLLFDANMATRPWTKVKNGTHYANGVDCVKGTSRDPNNLRATAGHPIAKVTFDYPIGDTYNYPSNSITRHDGSDRNPEQTPVPDGQPADYFKVIRNSSPIPLTFGHTNYAFDGDGCNWGSYALVTGKSTIWGNGKIALPADDATYGYNIDADPGMQKAFMYIDASEQPGDICAVDFEGEFCPKDKLMCTGWISGSNKIQGDTRCPGSITLTVKGEDKKGKSNTIYRFCPGQIYELDNGYGNEGYVQGETPDTNTQVGNAGIDGNENGATHVVWQQFYFEFSTDQKYERYWLEVNNNCVSSNGGDFMLDNVEVYTIVPEVEPDINTPLCISVSEDGTTVTDMRLLKLRINYNKLLSSRSVDLDENNTAEEGFAFLDKFKFLETFKTELQKLTDDEKHTLHLGDFDFTKITLDELATAIEEGKLSTVPTGEGSAYKIAFDAAILGNRSTWHSDRPGENLNASVMYFRWKKLDFETPNYKNMPLYSFADAVNKKSAVFYEKVMENGEEVTYVVMNGNFPGLQWKTNTDYYVINTVETYNLGTTVNGVYVPGNPCEAFNLCSECCKFSEFRIEPPLEVLGLDATENTEDLVVCEGQIPTLLTNLKGYDIHGNPVKMKNLNFDWWLGKKGDKTTNPVTPGVPATLDNYHAQYKLIDKDGEDVKANRIYLAYALSTMRAYYPGITSLEGITKHEEETPYLKDYMIEYLREVVNAGELLLHQTTVSVPAEQVLDSDPYFYLVACPIHDEMFDQALNPSASEYVAFYCDEPQGVRIKLGQKAPRLQTGFVPGEHNFNTYNYNFPANTNPVLSIRLAKAAQFETVKNTVAEVANEKDENTGEVTYNFSTAVNYLWLPIRNAETESANHVIKKSMDDNVYLASSNDLTWDKKISKEMNKPNGSLPVVGRIVELKAVNTKQGSTAPETENAYNRLCVYFNKDFNVREGYNYTLSLPFQEDDNSNACDGTILINLKIVPDYEVWTGAAGNIDWNNDENWRRADGNTNTTVTSDPINKGVYSDELYRADGAVGNADSPLHTYTTNKANYYSSAEEKKKKTKTPKPSSDQVLRKGFAPLYCTHVLLKNNEWGNAPELYDGLDVETATNNNKLKDEPFPNLRDTSTPILKFDMQARRYDMWEETYGVPSDRGNVSQVGNVTLTGDHSKDLIAEMYQINSCDEIAFQPGTELRNAHLLNYNTAWVEYQIDNKRWYLLGSPLQGTISGEWYAPTGTAKQKTTYYDPVSFRPRYVKVANPKSTDNPSERGWYKKSGENYVQATETEINSATDYYYLTVPCAYDRYSPAIYQRSWDKAKAVLYEVGSTYSINDDNQAQNLGNDYEGVWSSGSWGVEGNGTADEYLDRLGYKPMGGNKANVAIQGVWSNTYNDAQVDYATGGFSVMVMNHLKNNDQSGEVVDQSTNEKRYSSVIRLPKEDTMYDYYKFDQTNANDGGTDTELSDVRGKGRAKNRGRLKSDKLLPDGVDVTANSSTSTIAIKKQEKTFSIYGDKRDYTRVPTTEGPLQIMNSSFIAQDEEHPATAGFFPETIPAGATSTLNYYLVENPFPCGLDMDKFFTANADVLEAKYWLLTKTGQHLVQKAEVAGEWISPDEPEIEYPNPNYVAPASGDSGSGDPSSSDSEQLTEPETLQFYPNAVVAPGQGFFVQAKSDISGDLTVTFNRGMQAQSRFGVIDGEGEKYTIVVGQAQKMQKHKEYVDHDDNPETDPVLQTVYVFDDRNGNGIFGEKLDLNNNNIKGEEDITIIVDGEEVVVDEIEGEPVMEPVYEEIEDPDNPESTIKVPVLDDIEEEVTIYKYVPETLTTLDDPSTTETDESETIEKEYPLLSRQTRSTQHSKLPGLVITAKRGADQSSALVMLRNEASDDFLPSEDTETFIIGGELQSPAVPTVYTLCGRLATTINSIHDFRCLPLGVESNSDAPCVLTFKGVEQLGDSVAFYDAVEQKLTPLESGMKFTVSGQTQNRYFLVSSLIPEEAAAETHIQIFTEGLTATVIASTEEPIDNVRCYDTAGRLVHTAKPQTREYSFTLPQAGVYIIDAQTENDRKTKKIMAK